MRKIKFRAFGVFQAHFGSPKFEMKYDVFVKDGIAYILSQEFGCSISSPTALEKCRNAKVMQYTGLKDKKSVEIYEGDVVRFHDPDKQDEALLDKISGVGFIKWADCCLFRYWVSSLVEKDGFRLGFAMGDLGDLENVEVIGNIYENPELLEQ